MKIQSIIMLIAAFIFAGSITIAQNKDAVKSAKKDNCCQTQNKMTADKPKDCCQGQKKSAASPDCMNKDGQKIAGCNDVVKTDCCSKESKKAAPTGVKKDRDKK